MGKLVLFLIVLFLAPWLIGLLLALLFIYYLGPILLVGLSVMGCFMGAASVNPMHEKTISAQQDMAAALTHTVTVDWSGADPEFAEGMSYVISYGVREDYQWSVVTGVDVDLPVYGVTSVGGIINEIYEGLTESDSIDVMEQDEAFVREPTLQDLLENNNGSNAQKVKQAMDIAKAKGLTFGGLYTAPSGGGEQYVNARGCTLHSVKSDVYLYVCWR